MLWLYAIRSASKWELKFSLDWRVDICHWGAGQGEHVERESVSKVVLWHLRVPVQAALQAVERFSMELAMDRWDEEQWGVYAETLLSFFIERLKWPRGYARLKVRIMTNHELSVLALQMQHNGSLGLRGSLVKGNGALASDESSDGLSVYRCLMSLLIGKALLESEVRSAIEHNQLVLNDEQLLALLQQGVLEGYIELTNGVAWSLVSDSKGLLYGWKRRICGAVFQSRGNDTWEPTRREEYCRRCGSVGEQLRVTSCERCGSERCYTCLGCLQLGRSRTCGLLIIGKLRVIPLSDKWRGSGACGDGSEERHVEELLERFGLAPAQRDASQLALRYLEKHWQLGMAAKGEFLLWAVTGAGKTEMMYPLVAYALARGGRVCIATPRRDVVLELKPRIAKAFAHVRVVTLYGGSEERWGTGEVTLATTHQLMRFRDAFDLVVVDELDAFPFHNNPMLERAARQACAPGGAFVYLSATPPRAMQHAVRWGRLAQAIVPVRYHREPLPVPRRLTMPAVARVVVGGQLPVRLAQVIRQSLERGAQLFIFAARIRYIDGIVRLLRVALPKYAIEGTSSSDTLRTEKVQQFRRGEIRLLVTTTILERGVTVPKSDVIILDADDKLFDTSSLVQMAGRAGRSKDDPHGLVFFAAPQWTNSQRDAAAQIKRMNRLAKRGGYLRKEGGALDT